MLDTHHGFVVGFSLSQSGKKIWAVRVKDSQSKYNKQKLTVASIHEGLELARGLNVYFVIGTVDDKEGNKVLRAVSVCLEKPSQTEVQS